MDSDRMLRPLTEAQPSIDRLDTYESPAALTEALRAIWHGVDRTLRTMLREDPSVPDDLRLTALSQELVKHEAVIGELRRRNVISLELAGRVHDLQQAVARDVRAADADSARALVHQLRSEVQALPRAAAVARAPASSVPAAAVTAKTPAPARTAAQTAPEPPQSEADEKRDAGARKRALLLGGIAALILVGTILAIHFRDLSSSMEKGVAAFRNDSMGIAEQHFRAALNDDRTSVTAQLYLGRVLREQGRYKEAADLLNSAATTSPQDAAVRRELGYLFLDLKTPAKAAVQFEKAVELDPEEPLSWVGLVEALTKANDPRAAQMRTRAPAEAQAMLQSSRR